MFVFPRAIVGSDPRSLGPNPEAFCDLCYGRGLWPIGVLWCVMLGPRHAKWVVEPDFLLWLAQASAVMFVWAAWALQHNMMDSDTREHNWDARYTSCSSFGFFTITKKRHAQGCLFLTDVFLNERAK